MPITSVTSDANALTLTVVGDYAVPVEWLWDAWVDPRQLERFFGPPDYPATFTRHDMVVGGRSSYVMTGAAGVTHGYWIVTAIDPGRSFEVIDGFAGDDGNPNDEMPTMTMRFSFESTESGSRFVGVTTFASVEAMEQLVEMGMVEGATAAFGQMDDVLADLASFAAGRSTESKILNDTQVRFTRIVRGSVEQVWRAHHDADLVQRWMLGPDGWTMPVCEVPGEVGSTFRYGWEAEDGSGGFGLEGEVLESVPPHREVTTERMVGMEGDPATNEMTLTAVDGGTLLMLVVTYPSSEVRDQALATGMVDGMESSYARLESTLVNA
ncbi:MAG: SRPBCC family protein [Ilumatobacter sp.]|uniref:SRPBCC family protein n=1 Tax=Ilumatobacter sp. TaxID=1967498 RepID=UPI00261C0C5B|nr:SRPBCC family protein [Ilumatobacter sp.]MDJ0767166.1 SRPBCC family protein [Ilumatobacter sp.]